MVVKVVEVMVMVTSDPDHDAYENGAANTGGGAGAADGAGTAGGSGVVILKYPSTKTITIGAGLTSTTDTEGSNKITTFTAGTGKCELGIMSRLKVDNIEARSGNNIAFEDPMQLKSVTTTQRNALSSPQAGDVVYNSTTGTIDFYNGSDWYATSSTTFTVRCFIFSYCRWCIWCWWWTR